MPNPRRPRTFRAVTADVVQRRAGGRRLVVVAPHPDDETLGCGALLRQARRAGVAVAVISLTDGGASHPGSRRWPPAALGRLRAGELRRAMARLGLGTVPLRRLGWGDGRLDGDAGVRRLRALLVGLRAGVVLATSPADHHPDHRAAWRVTAAAARGLRLPLVSYAVWSRLGGAAVRQPRSTAAAAKRWAIAAHRSQVGGYIADDPDGFMLTPAELARFVGEPERFAVPREAVGSRRDILPR